MMEEEAKNKDDDEISLIDLFAVLWHRKKMIIAITLSAAVGVVIFSIITIVLPPEISPLPNLYTPRALVLIDDTTSPGGGGLPAGMGGLAAFAGVSVSGGATHSQLAVFLLETHALLDAIVDEFSLIERYNIERFPRAESRRQLSRLLRASFDDMTGVLTVSFTDKDPIFARDVVDFTVGLLERRFDELGLDRNKIEQENLVVNLAATFQDIIGLEEERRRLEQSVAFAPLGGGGPPAIAMDLARISMELEAKRQVYTELMVQSELLRVRMASESPVFQILEMAEAPDQKSRPSRGLICIIVTLAAGFFSVFLAFALNAISNIRKDSQAMAKIRGGQ